MLDQERAGEPSKHQHASSRAAKVGRAAALQQLQHALGRLLHPYQELIKLARSALFLACLVHLLGPLLAPLETPSRMVLALAGAHLGAASNPQLDLADRLLVLKLDRSTFRARATPNQVLEFNGISPLDRCVLRERLKDMLKAMPNLKVLGLDLDVSPTGQAGQDQCGQDILQLLAGKEGLKSFLILPVDKEDRRELTAWRKQVQAQGLFLANPDLLVEYGLVRRHELVSVHVDKGSSRPLCPSLGVAMAGPAHELQLTRSPGDTWRQALEACFDPSLDMDEDSVPLGHHPLVRHEHNIAFQHISKRLAVPEINEAETSIKPLAEQLKRPGIEKVRWAILGADYDRSDSFRTPLGELSGVEVHAAIATDPAESVSHFWGLLLDVSLGIGFGWFVHQVWQRYFNQKLGLSASPFVDADKRAYVLLIGLLAVWLLLALLVLPALSLGALLWGSLWINPVPMLIGMSVDAFVLGSVAGALHLMHHSTHTAHEGKPHSIARPNTEVHSTVHSSKSQAPHPAHRRRGPIRMAWHGFLARAPKWIWRVVVVGTALSLALASH